jgi:carbonic anhydrase
VQQFGVAIGPGNEGARRRHRDQAAGRGVVMEKSDPVTADEALRRLHDGNARFQTRRNALPHGAEGDPGPTRTATILGCSDSRVPPELIFDAGFGELFVVRVAGNVLSPEVSGSIQYAGAHLHTPLFVVLGHEGCGAVKAALDTQLHGVRQRSRIQILVDGILPGLSAVDSQAPPAVQLAQAVEANVRRTMRQILETVEQQSAIAEGRMKLIGGIYEIVSGRVRFLT